MKTGYATGSIIKNKKRWPVEKKRSTEGYTTNNTVRFIRGGAAYFNQMLQMIDQAKQSIHLQTYIFDDDATGRLVGDALKKAAQRGVNVYMMADGYASRALSGSFIHELITAGVHFRFFEPLIRSKHFYFGRRLHHKIIVADTQCAMVGGLNITERYNDRPGYTAWLDFAVWVKGEIVKELCTLCWKTWKGFPVKTGVLPCEQEYLYTPPITGTTSRVRMRINDWVRNKNEISGSYMEMLKTAQSHVVILCSYFLPGAMFRKKLSLAAKRGVKIKIILAGLSDIKLAKYAERYIYDWLLRNNIAIYEYQGNVLHGKVSVCDSAWLTIGSYNINNISAHASIELNLDIRDQHFAAEVEAVFEAIIEKECIHVTRERLIQKRSLLKRFIWWCSYQTVKGLIYLFTFYFRKRN
ncbi:phospholipase D-like domain-containing protein [Agriterribacter sp.]|uniref:phospholipase D-like domain-containing protein n=1 Tax=Agriterribacter sp. TaxID=2821509 RepID=UPI002B7A6E6B|nr:phospholipase D-like domain-containing protein [Agriterribacter sp.]HTN07443.1 phospholipase D-like domain-containing protein [Agriterribacter sp.]